MIPDSPRVDDVAPSPNFGDRRGKPIDALILHYTGMQSGEAALAWLRNADSGVSCHYLVWEDGRVTQLVAENDRAWHAGIGKWAGDGDMNSVSIGIEVVNFGHQGGLPPYPPAQIQAVIALCRDICERRRIAAHRVLAHSDMAPGARSTRASTSRGTSSRPTASASGFARRCRPARRCSGRVTPARRCATCNIGWRRWATPATRPAYMTTRPRSSSPLSNGTGVRPGSTAARTLRP